MAIRPRARRFITIARQSPASWLDVQTNVRNWHLDELTGLVAFESPTSIYPGADVAVNGSFLTDTDWNKGVGVTIAGGQAIWTASTGNITATVPPTTASIRYKTTIDIESMSGDTMTVKLGSTNTGSISSIGVSTFEITANGTALQITPWAGSGLTAAVNSIIVQPANPLNLDNSGLLIGQAGAGNIQYMYSGTGAAAERLTFNPITQYTADFDRANGGKVITAKSSTWAAGIDVLWHSGVDATNFVEIRRDGTDLIVEYQEGGNQSIATVPSGSPSGAFTIAASWDVAGHGIRSIYNGVQVDTDKAIGSAIVGALDITLCALFAADSSGANSWAGSGAEASLQIETKPISWYTEYHNRMGV